MLKSIKVHNFKTFLNTELEFGSQHLVIGKNNSGKTNLAYLLRYIAATTILDLDRATNWLPGGLDEICNWHLRSGQIDFSCSCVLELDGIEHQYTYELHLDCSTVNATRIDQLSRLRILGERLVVSGGDLNELILLESDGKSVVLANEEPDAPSKGASPMASSTLPAPNNATMLSKVYELHSNRRTTLFREYLGNWRYFSLSPVLMRFGSPDSLRGGSTPQTNPPVVSWTACDPLGENLSNALFHLKNFDEKRYRRLLQHVEIIEPALEAINFLVVPGRSPVPFVELTGQPRASWIGLSDGTLRALGLALIIETAAACSPPQVPGSCLSIIEEPENGISPGVLRRFFDLFENWAPTAQFIFTSHSPYLIDMFDHKRECVSIFKKEADRTATIHPRKATSLNGDDRFSLSVEYASELYQ